MTNIKKTIVIYKGQCMVSASWILRRVREMKVRDDSITWSSYNMALKEVGMILRKETHRAKHRAIQSKANKAKIQSQQPKNQ